MDPTLLETLSHILTRGEGDDSLPGHLGESAEGNLALAAPSQLMDGDTDDTLPESLEAPVTDTPEASDLTIPDLPTPVRGKESGPATYEPHSPSPFPLPLDFPREPGLELPPFATPEAPAAHNLPSHQVPDRRAVEFPPSVESEVPRPSDLPTAGPETPGASTLPLDDEGGDRQVSLLQDIKDALAVLGQPKSVPDRSVPPGQVVWSAAMDIPAVPFNATPASPSIPWVRK